MAGLGKYSVSPELTGGIFVKHEHSSLSRTYDNEISFHLDLQKHDWKTFFTAIKDVLAAVEKIYKGGYFKRNPSSQLMIITTVRDAIAALPKMNPVDQGKEVKYMIEILPLFARTSQYQYNKAVTDNVKIIAEYYDRYLLKHENFNNSFLTA